MSDVSHDAAAAGGVDAFGVDAFGKDPAVLQAMRPRLDALLDRWFRVVVEGAENLPADGRVILVANHGGALPWDALVLIAALLRSGREVRPLVEDAVMTAPFLGTFMTRLGCVRASQDNATRLLERGEACLVFPEGEQGLGKTYRRRHQLQRFGRGGFVRLAVRSKSPLVPVAVVGAEDTAPLLGKVEAFSGLVGDLLPWLPVTPTFPLLGPLGLLPLPARWRIRVGQPVDVSHVKDEGDAIAVNEVAAAVRDRLQKDVDDLVDVRGGAFF
jgi:1-acyl-sn-glycerol-3-phosphate acyltransferase